MKTMYLVNALSRGVTPGVTSQTNQSTAPAVAEAGLPPTGGGGC